MRRSNIPAFLLLASVVALVAVFLGWWFAPGPRPAPEPEATLEVAAAPEAQAGPMNFDELAALLNAHAANPAGAAFAAEFNARPKLRRLWTDFLERAAHSRARQEAGPTAEQFLRELRRESDFGALFSKYSSDRAFRALSDELTRRPSVSAALRGGLTGPTGVSETQPQAAASGKVFGLYAAEDLSHPVPAAAPVGRPASVTKLDQPTRTSSDPRIEGHWVHDGGVADPFAVCRGLAGTEACRNVYAECRRDPTCAKRLAASGGAPAAGRGGVGASSSTARGERGPKTRQQPRVELPK